MRPNSRAVRRPSAGRLRGGAIAVLAALSVAACSSSSGTLPTAADTTAAASAASTAADSTALAIDSSSADSSSADSSSPDSSSADTTAADSTVADSTGADTSAADTTSLSSTTIPPTTIVHGAGVSLTTPDGDSVNAFAASTAQSVYEAAIVHDYGRLRDIIGDRRFRWGFVGQHGPTEAWKAQFDAGKGDELARIAALLESPPAMEGTGGYVWPYLAVKDPATWTPADEEFLRTKLGFNEENVAQTKLKGRYVDYKLRITSDGLWTAFGLGY